MKFNMIILAWVIGLVLLAAVLMKTPSASPTTTVAPLHQVPIHISYDEAARYPKHYLGQAVVFSGKVLQVLNESDGLLMRVVVTKDEHGWWNYENVILLKYRDPLKSDGRILDNDIVEFRGIFKGIQNYKSLLGQTIAKPGVTACHVRVISNPNPRAARDCT